LVLLKSETVPPEELVSVAPVMLNWKNKTVTPFGGVSVTVRPTGTWVRFVAGVVGVGACDWLPHPDINSRNTARKNN